MAWVPIEHVKRRREKNRAGVGMDADDDKWNQATHLRPSTLFSRRWEEEKGKGGGKGMEKREQSVGCITACSIALGLFA